MGSYRNDDEALLALARQLTDAYGEARTREDQDYACDSLAEYLSEFRETAPSEALLAVFDLPLTVETFPLVDEAQTTLAARGPAIVELLLAAALGEVYDPDGPAPERAAETLDSMAPGEVSLGLTEVLCGRGDDQLKSAAVDALVALGGVAEPDLVVMLGDPTGGEWARAALELLRFAREHPDAADEAAPEDGLPGDAGATDEALDAAADDEPGDGVGEAAATEAAEAGEALAGGPAAPDQDLVDGAYEGFLHRFEQEAGGGAPGRPGDATGEAAGDATGDATAS
jgi:hypothetical protein